jgi:hypothetical protein
MNWTIGFFLFLQSILFAASASANIKAEVFVSDLENGYSFYEELVPYLAKDLHAKIRQEHPEVVKVFPDLTRGGAGRRPEHGSGVLVRMALGIQPWEDPKNEPPLNEELRLVPLVYADPLPQAYRLAIQHGVFFHNFSVGLDLVPATQDSLMEMSEVVRENPNAFFITATGNEGRSEAQTLGKFPQLLALSGLPNLLMAGNSRDLGSQGETLLGDVESPYEIYISNWTESSRFYICLGCASTTGAAAYLSRLLASITQNLMKAEVAEPHSSAVASLDSCLPKAWFKMKGPMGERPYFKRSDDFSKSISSCALERSAKVHRMRH